MQCLGGQAAHDEEREEEGWEWREKSKEEHDDQLMMTVTSNFGEMEEGKKKENKFCKRE